MISKGQRYRFGDDEFTISNVCLDGTVIVHTNLLGLLESYSTVRAADALAMVQAGLWERVDVESVA